MSKYEFGTTDDSSTNTETDSIEYNGKTYTDYIECSDGSQVPKIEERFEEAEEYRLAVMVAWKFGSDVGNSDLASTIYNEDSEKFPNRAIGQTEESAEPCMDNAISPGHYVYREFGSKIAKQKAKTAFHEECEKRGIPKSLLVYKKNFHDAGMPDEEFVTVEENEDEPWEAIQIPKAWNDRFDGMPEVLMEMPEAPEESEPEPEPEPEEWNGVIEFDDDDYDDCNTDAGRMRVILNQNPAFANIDKSEQVEIFTEEFGFGESNVYATLRKWNSEESEQKENEKGDTDDTDDNEMVEITREEYENLQDKADKLETLQDLMN